MTLSDLQLTLSDLQLTLSDLQLTLPKHPYIDNITLTGECWNHT